MISRSRAGRQLLEKQLRIVNWDDADLFVELQPPAARPPLVDAWREGASRGVWYLMAAHPTARTMVTFPGRPVKPPDVPTTYVMEGDVYQFKEDMEAFAVLDPLLAVRDEREPPAREDDGTKDSWRKMSMEALAGLTPSPKLRSAEAEAETPLAGLSMNSNSEKQKTVGKVRQPFTSAAWGHESGAVANPGLVTLSHSVYRETGPCCQGGKRQHSTAGVAARPQHGPERNLTLL
jgi:hypothetical protein